MSYKVEKNKLTQLFSPIDNQVNITDAPLPKGSYYIWIIVGKRGSGKSNLILNALGNKEAYKKYYDNIYLVSPTASKDSKFEKLCEELDREDKCYDECSDKIISEIVDKITAFNDNYKKKGKPRNLLILDDCLAQLPRSTQKNSAFNKLIVGNRHAKLDIWITTQQFKKVNPLIRANADLVSFFANDNVMERKAFLDEYGISEELLDDATGEKHSFLHISFNSNKPTYYKRFDKYII